MSKSKEDAVLEASARGATYLVLLQISSRGFTFIVNQILLRYLSPELLGLSSQLELYAISVLYFSRESLRVALQRQGGGGSSEKGKEGQIVTGTVVRRAQEVVNLTYIPIVLGPFLAYLFSWMYLSKATTSVLAVPHIHEALTLYSLAAVLELCVEPCFAVANQQMLYGLRAAAETVATLMRCIVTCSTAIWGSKAGESFGALPFAFGQLGYAIGLILIYYGSIWNKAPGFRLVPRSLSADHILTLFSRPALTLALNLYAQSGLKHLLTQGDSLLIALFTDLASQGVYALASNYGSLLARVLFSPIEESSRGLFGRLLSSPASTKTATINSNSNSKSKSTPSTTGPPSSQALVPLPSLRSAHTYLTTLLRAYSLLALLLTTLAPRLAPPLLSLLAGRAWRSTSAPRVLALYCYYLPLLAYNGVLEAFVAAVATPAQLRTQSAWMLAFSAAYVCAGWVLLGLFGYGAEGLVGANAVNMLVRIVWCSVWVEGWWREQKEAREKERLKGEKGGEGEVPEFRVLSRETLPGLATVSTGVGGWSLLWGLQAYGFERGWKELAVLGAAAGIVGLLMLGLEQDLILELYRTVRPGKAENKGKATDSLDEKKEL